MRVTVLSVGKLREAYWRSAADEYIKRLSRYVHVSVTEVPDQPEDDPQAMRKEGEALLARIRPEDYVIALCVDARQMDSAALARFFRERAMLGARVVFVTGGSLGLSEDVLRRADERLSMSAMTFPHQLARVMLLEQIYRAHKINAGERYHK